MDNRFNTCTVPNLFHCFQNFFVSLGKVQVFFSPFCRIFEMKSHFPQLESEGVLHKFPLVTKERGVLRDIYGPKTPPHVRHLNHLVDQIARLTRNGTRPFDVPITTCPLNWQLNLHLQVSFSMDTYFLYLGQGWHQQNFKGSLFCGCPGMLFSLKAAVKARKSFLSCFWFHAQSESHPVAACWFHTRGSINSTSALNAEFSGSKLVMQTRSSAQGNCSAKSLAGNVVNSSLSSLSKTFSKVSVKILNTNLWSDWYVVQGGSGHKHTNLE